MGAGASAQAAPRTIAIHDRRAVPAWTIACRSACSLPAATGLRTSVEMRLLEDPGVLSGILAPSHKALLFKSMPVFRSSACADQDARGGEVRARSIDNSEASPAGLTAQVDFADLLAQCARTRVYPSSGGPSSSR